LSGPTIFGSNGNELFTNENPAKVSLATGSIQTTPSGKQDVKVVDPLPAGTNIIGGATLTGASGAQGVISTGANSNDANGISNNLLYTASYQLAFNGATWDRWRNNIDAVLLSLLKRTTEATSPVVTNLNGKGVMVHLRITDRTVLTAPKLKFAVRSISSEGQPFYLGNIEFDPVVGNHTFVIYPASSGVPKGNPDGLLKFVSDMPIGKKFDIRLTHTADITDLTYSLSYHVLV